ncbi:MAG: hypothetical protein KBC62_04335 [Candidatus Pacebacteria bacterium]|nr:hypothetical protein [Candidatus Paceibacterota bacterium]MBP9843205.1 hypothetical protein [Candidatus Paceibacterota bacterium]
MPHTQKLIIVSLALIAGVGLGALISKAISIDTVPSYDEMIPIISHTPDTGGFKDALMPLLQVRFGTSSTSFEPRELLYVYPGIKPEDFNSVEAIIGNYEFKDGFLWYLGDGVEDEPGNSISDTGFVTLHKNIQSRLKDSSHVVPSELVKILEKTPAPSTEEPIAVIENPDTPVENPEEPTMCTMDAKMCPDGSFVGRTAPGCAFAECPSETPPSGEEIVCTPTQREAEACIEIYAPVCASYQVQCITTPCNPVPKSYPNSCFACADNNVISYSEGSCASEPLTVE